MLRYKAIRVCRTPTERALGLQHRAIADDECCLFMFDAPEQVSFWGKNTVQPLYMNCIKNGEVMESYLLEQGSREPVRSMGEYSVVMETLRDLGGRAVLMLPGYVEII